MGPVIYYVVMFCKFLVNLITISLITIHRNGDNSACLSPYSPFFRGTSPLRKDQPESTKKSSKKTKKEAKKTKQIKKDDV